MLLIEVGEVAAAHARPQRHQLERPQRPLRMLQYDAGADGRAQQHRGGEKDRVAPAGQRMKNEDGMRIVAPASPDIAVSVNSSSLLNGNPRLSICTAMMPHIIHTAKPHIVSKSEIASLRLSSLLAGSFPELDVLYIPLFDVSHDCLASFLRIHCYRFVMVPLSASHWLHDRRLRYYGF